MPYHFDLQGGASSNMSSIGASVGGKTAWYQVSCVPGRRRCLVCWRLRRVLRPLRSHRHEGDVCLDRGDFERRGLVEVVRVGHVGREVEFSEGRLLDLLGREWRVHAIALALLDLAVDRRGVIGDQARRAPRLFELDRDDG